MSVRFGLEPSLEPFLGLVNGQLDAFLRPRDDGAVACVLAAAAAAAPQQPQVAVCSWFSLRFNLFLRIDPLTVLVPSDTDGDHRTTSRTLVLALRRHATPHLNIHYVRPFPLVSWMVSFTTNRQRF